MSIMLTMITMIQFLFIYSVMMFITTFVYINRSNDKINQAFLAFMGVLVTWMVLSVVVGYEDTSYLPLIVSTIYWWCMMNFSVFFLFFVYRFIQRKLDVLYYLLVSLNTLTIFSRYLFPIDYSEPSFWRLSIPIVAPAMTISFSLPAVYALYLIIRQFFVSKNAQQKAQLKVMFFGISLALIVSVLSEYVLPTLFNVVDQQSLMYLAMLIFSMSIFLAIMKHRLLSIRTDYIYRKMFLNSGDGIIIIDKNHKIVNINNVAKEILQDDNIGVGDLITNYISDYRFDTNYNRQESTYISGKRTVYLSISQHPIDSEADSPIKLLAIADITASKLQQLEELNQLVKKSSIDQLTGMLNKQSLLDCCNNNNLDSTSNHKAVIFVDVDNFKTINDQFGHLVGDSALTAVAQRIRDCIGTGAKAFRFGGDEFVIVLDSPSMDMPWTIAERIRSCINGRPFVHGYLRFDLSVSIGVVEGTKPLKILVDRADTAMYNSKDAGKNKSTVYSMDEAAQTKESAPTHTETQF